MSVFVVFQVEKLRRRLALWSALPSLHFPSHNVIYIHRKFRRRSKCSGESHFIYKVIRLIRVSPILLILCSRNIPGEAWAGCLVSEYTVILPTSDNLVRLPQKSELYVNLANVVTFLTIHDCACL